MKKHTFAKPLPRKKEAPTNAQRFERIMVDLKVPAPRVTGTKTNAMWFLRSGLVVYRSHPKFEDARKIALAMANE